MGGGDISIRGVSKTFASRGQEVIALQKVSCEVPSGQFAAVLGPSGCGKTTLLNIIAGFEVQSSGAVTVDGQEVTGPGPDRGVVFQDHALFPWLTVEKNVIYGLRARGVSKADQDEAVSHYLGLAGLRGFESRYPHELSGGMRQRVGLVRVLANDADVLLMDEPFASVDAQTRRSLQRQVERIWLQDQKTVFFITHSVEEAIYLADVVFVMTARPGRIKQILPVDLPRPRDVTSVEFNEIRRQTELLVEVEADKTLEQQKSGSL
jgi:NitT/TauT family transport system ATP-binding protein